MILAVTSILLQPCRSVGANRIEIYGRVLDPRGQPVANATLMVFDFSSSKTYFAYTDSLGFYRVEVPSVNPLGAPPEYIIYATHIDPRRKIPDYTIEVYPPNPYDGKSRIRRNSEVDLTLYPAATLLLEGKPWYIEALGETLYYVFKLVDPTSLTLLKPTDGAIAIYGNPPYAYADEPDVRFLLGKLLNSSIVVLPADTPTILEVEIGFRTGVKVETVRFLFGSKGKKPFSLNQGETLGVNLEAASILFNVEHLRSKAKKVYEKLANALKDGFFTGGESEDLREALRLLEEAERRASLTPVNLKTIRFTLVEQAYYIIKGVEARIAYMYSTTEAQYLFYPWLLAFLALVFSSFLFDTDRPKIVCSILCYGFLLTLFILVYPTVESIFFKEMIVDTPIFKFKILNLHLFLVNSLFSFLFMFSTFYYAPRKFTGPEITGKASVREIFTAIVSIAKRNVKRRKIRGFFSIITVAILVFSFTTLTSISWVYGVKTVGIEPPSRQIEGVLVRRFPVGEDAPIDVLHFLSLSEVEGLADLMGEGSVIPKAQNIPSSRPILLLEASSGKAEVYGVIGVKPDLEDKITGLHSYLTGGNLEDETGSRIALTRSLARKLNVKVGDGLKVYDVTGVEAKFLGVFKIDALVEDDYFKSRDLDGSFLTPFREEEGEFVPVDPEAVVVLNYDTLLKFNLNSIGVSRVFIEISEGREASDLARVLAMRGYTTILFHEARAVVMYLDTVLEIKGVIEFLVPFTLVLLNTVAVFVQIAYERERELKTLATLGLTPGHIASLFILESMVIGLVGGGLGYLSGLGAYRLISLLGEQWQIGVREKLEWYWSIVGIAIALLVTLLSAVKSAFDAAMKVTPSMVRRVKLKPEERIEREKRILRAFEEREFTMPVRVRRRELEFFEAFLVDTLRSMKITLTERVDNLRINRSQPAKPEEPIPEERIEFRYMFTEKSEVYEVYCTIMLSYISDLETYRVVLKCKPSRPGIPQYALEYTARTMRRLMLEWIRSKERIIGNL